MTASRQPDAEHAPLTSPAAAGSGSTGHDKAVEIVSEVVYNDWQNEVHAAEKILAALRAALAAGDTNVAGPAAEALGLHRRVMWADNRSDRKGEAVWFQTTPVWTWTEIP